jgi:5-methylthioadenosine/S-adenosylhomocysteine deaminase
MIDSGRRKLLLGGLATAAVAPLALSGCAAAGSSPPLGGPLLIRGAYIMSMDRAVGDMASGDVMVREGRIAAVGPSIPSEGATVIDARDMVLLPGFVDTHTHFWTTQMRGLFGDTPERIYFLTRNKLANGFQPADMYIGTLLGAVEAVHGGITTALDFCHNVRLEAAALECIRALSESGLRTRYLYGPSTTTPPSQPMDLPSLERTHARWQSLVGDAPVTLGMAWRGPLGATTIVGQQMPPAVAVAKAEFDTARRLGLPMSVHVSGGLAEQQFNALVAGNFLGSDVQLIHMSNVTAAQLAQAARAGSPVALTPVTELRVGYGLTQLGDYLDSGVKLGVGVDSNSLAGSADMFQILRLFQGVEAGRKKNELATNPRKLLELATIGGATSLGLDKEIGSVTVGKKADLQLINTRAVNLGMFASDPAHLIVEAARPENVDTVIVDGKILKRNGVLTRHDAGQLVGRARQSIQEVIKRVG